METRFKASVWMGVIQGGCQACVFACCPSWRTFARIWGTGTTVFPSSRTRTVCACTARPCACTFWGTPCTRTGRLKNPSFTTAINIGKLANTRNTPTSLVPKAQRVFALEHLVHHLVDLGLLELDVAMLAGHMVHHGALLLRPVGANGALELRSALALVLLVPPEGPFRLVAAPAFFTRVHQIAYKLKMLVMIYGPSGTFQCGLKMSPKLSGNRAN